MAPIQNNINISSLYTGQNKSAGGVKSGGKDFGTQIGDMLSGYATGTMDGVVDSATSHIKDPVLSAVVNVGIKVGIAALLGAFQKGVDKKEAKEDVKVGTANANKMKTTGDQLQQTTSGILTEGQTQMLAEKQKATEVKTNLENQGNDAVKLTTENNETIQKEQKLIDENNKKIDNIREQQNQLLTQIKGQQQKGQIRQGGSAVPNNGGQEGKVGGNSYTLDASQYSPEAQELIAKYNELGGEIGGLVNQNTQNSNNILALYNQNSEIKLGLTDATEEGMREFDEAYNNILTTSQTTEDKVKGVTELLQSKTTGYTTQSLTAVATEMVKAGVNTTESATFATAAAAFQAAAAAAAAGSVFTLGASSGAAAELEQKAIKCMEGSKDKAAGAFERALSQALMTSLQQMTTTCLNQTIGNITAGLGTTMGMSADTQDILGSFTQTFGQELLSNTMTA